MFKYALIGLAVVSIVLVSVLAITNDSPSSNTTYSAESVLEESKNGEAVILDVRTPVEYDLGHVETASNYNVELLNDGKLPDIEKNEKIYLYCNSGNRSAQAEEILTEAGYTNTVDIGGLSDWEAIGGTFVESDLKDYREMLLEIGEEPIAPLGPADAELVMVKYSDFQCPYCARYAVETEPEIMEKYVRGEDAKVRYEFRNLPFLGDESALAAAAGYCANEQGLFWEYHDLLSYNYAISGPEVLSLSNMAEIVGASSGDAVSFTSCVESGKYYSIVSSEALEAKRNGINTTPTIIVGEQTINGALPLATYEAAINAQL